MEEVRINAATCVIQVTHDKAVQIGGTSMTIEQIASLRAHYSLPRSTHFVIATRSTVPKPWNRTIMDALTVQGFWKLDFEVIQEEPNKALNATSQ